MAYLKPTRLCCPGCGFSAEVTIVVGVGPGSRKGDIPYRTITEPAPFAEGETEDGRRCLLCPEDGACVWIAQPGQPALGPLTKREMQGPLGRAWLIPGSENPFPPQFAKYRPGDPFSGPPPEEEQ